MPSESNARWDDYYHGLCVTNEMWSAGAPEVAWVVVEAVAQVSHVTTVCGVTCIHMQLG